MGVIIVMLGAIILILLLLPTLVSVIQSVLLYFVRKELSIIRIPIFIIIAFALLGSVVDFFSKISHPFVSGFIIAILLVVVYKVIKSKQ